MRDDVVIVPYNEGESIVEKNIKIGEAVKTTWMILEGLGYLEKENPALAETVERVFDTAPADDIPGGENDMGIRDAINVETGEIIHAVAFEYTIPSPDFPFQPAPLPMNLEARAKELRENGCAVPVAAEVCVKKGEFLYTVAYMHRKWEIRTYEENAPELTAEEIEYAKRRVYEILGKALDSAISRLEPAANEE